MKAPRIIILTGVTDDNYRSQRTDNPIVSTSAGKRILLYRAIESAAGAAPLLLSPHPRGRGRPSALPAMESNFDRFTQRFSRASGIRKVRFFLDLLHYASHVHRNTKNGDVLIMDNYELIYVLAIYYLRLRGRRNRIVLEYEDGKHLIDKGWIGWLSGLAEFLGKRLVGGAIVAAPALVERLPGGIPVEIVPGILGEDIRMNPLPIDGSPIRFIYSGSLDFERGVPLLLDYLESGQMAENAVFHVTGQGHFVKRFEGLAERHPGKIVFHGCVSREELGRIQQSCHFGLNLQISDNPISQVTYPSKTFDYLNAGLGIVSTRAAAVDTVLGNIPVYMDTETGEGLADAINRITGHAFPCQPADLSSMAGYSLQGTIKRLVAVIRPATNIHNP